MRQKSKAIFSFFAGAGLLDLGFEKTGFDVVYVNEVYKPFFEAYKFARQGMGMQEPILGHLSDDIAKLSTSKNKHALGRLLKEAKSRYDMVGFIGGPPCPDFSVGGKNRGRNGDNGRLSGVYASLIVQQKPDFFVFENVKGLWSTRIHREFYEELKKKMQIAGYLTTEKLINAIEYGAPQDRERIILVGFKKEFVPRNCLNGKSLLLDHVFPWTKFSPYSRAVFTKRWPGINPFAEGSELPKPTEVEEKLTVKYWFERNNVEKHPNATNHFMPRAGLKRFQSIDEGDVSKKSFKRLHRWRYSPTAAYGHNEVHLHPYKARRISVAEAFSIQSLPSDFSFPHDMTLSDMFKAVGNGVPYLASRGIAQSINDFAGEL